MSGFSAEKALTSGFRVIARRPSVLPAWGAVYLVFGFGPQGLIWLRLLPQIAARSQDPDAMASAMSGLMPWSPVLWIIGITLASVLYGAVYRAVLEPEDRGFFYLRLSSRELWLGLTMIVLVLVFGLGGAAAVVAVVLIAHTAPGIVAFLIGLAAVVGFIWLAMRFSLATPMAFSQRRFIFTESWRLTGGQVLKLVGVALALVVILLAMEMVLMVPVMVALVSSGAFHNPPGDPSVLLRNAAPWIAVGCVVLPLFAALYYSVVSAPWAEIYRELTADSEGA